METSELWPNLVSKSSLSGATKPQNECNNSHNLHNKLWARKIKINFYSYLANESNQEDIQQIL